MMQDVPGWAVMCWNPATMMWTRRDWHPVERSARRQASLLAAQQQRVFVKYAPTKVAVPDPAPRPTAAALFREEQAARMVERAAAMKRYKSMG